VKPDTRERLSDILAIGAFVVASGVLIDAGVVCSNDGSHYAIVRAIGDTGSFVIDPYVSYTADVDISTYGGAFFSDRPPGTAFLAVPFYLVGRLFSSDPAAHEFAASLLSVFAAFVACVCTYWLARQLGRSRAGARMAAITLGIATPFRSYASTLFHHAVAAMLVSLVAVLALDHIARPRRSTRMIAAVLSGYAVCVDYTTCLLTGMLLLGALILPLRNERGEMLRAFGEVVAAGVVGLVPLLAYNAACFGSPFSLAYDHQVHFSMMHSMSGIYGGSVPDGLFGLFFHPRSGLVFWSPVIALALWFGPSLMGGADAPDTVKRDARLLGIALVPFVLLTSRYYEVGAGAARDARYLMPMLPLLLVPLAAAYDRALARADGGPEKARPALLIAYAVLLTLSIELQVAKHLARWVRNGEFWLPRFETSTDVGTTVVHFLGWAFPHPLAALVILVAGLAASRAVATGAKVATE
jgi:4-amino-4-deoxy-L-arabinose transferase-like glycosyltransferase